MSMAEMLGLAERLEMQVDNFDRLGNPINYLASRFSNLTFRFTDRWNASMTALRTKFWEGTP